MRAIKSVFRNVYFAFVVALLTFNAMIVPEWHYMKSSGQCAVALDYLLVYGVRQPSRQELAAWEAEADAAQEVALYRQAQKKGR